VRGDRLRNAIAVEAELDPRQLADEQPQPGLVPDDQHVPRPVGVGVQAADPLDDVARAARDFDHRLAAGSALHRIGEPASKSQRIGALDLVLGAALPRAPVDLVETAIDHRHLAERGRERGRRLHRAPARADVDRAPDRPALMARPPSGEGFRHAVAFWRELGVEHPAKSILAAELGLAVS